MQQDQEHKAPIATSELTRTLTDPAFLAALCHDLRGPLGAIGTWVHVLASGRATATTQQQALAAMQRDVASQRRLIEQLSDISSIVGGTLQLSVEDLDLGPLLAALGIALQAEGASHRVLADARRLRQLLAILLSVTEGTAPEGPAPGLTAGHEGPGALLIRGTTRKDGPGLIGLSLVRALVELQGGQLTLAPAAQGTAFTIQLPTPRSGQI